MAEVRSDITVDHTVLV